jgi:hypothetical protein
MGVLAWLDPNYLTAAATAALAVIAGLQIAREIQSSQRRGDTTRRRLAGVAWLARRTCEVTLRQGVGGSPGQLAIRFTDGKRLDRLEGHFREVLRLSSMLGGDAAARGASAFEGFLAASDRFNYIRASAPVSEFPDLADQALQFLYAAVNDLEQLAPRRIHEPPLPNPMTLRSGPRTIPQPSSPSAPPPPREGIQQRSVEGDEAEAGEA